MEKTVEAYLEMVRAWPVPVVAGETEIVVGRLSLSVLPSVEADPPARLFMEIPEDLRPDEAAVPMALKACLVGMDRLPGFLARLKESLHAGREHREQCGPWLVACSEKGSLLSIEARYQPSPGAPPRD